MIRFAILALFVFAFPFPTTAETPKVKPLAKDQTIVFLGDSITQAGNDKGGYVALIREELARKYKDLNVKVVGAGISGNKVPDLQKRVDKDVIEKKPSIVVIYIGINDVWHGENDPAKGTPKDKFDMGLREVIEKITKSGAQVILCTPSVIGELPDGTNKNDPRLDEYSEVSRNIAKELNLPLCDLRKEFIVYLKDKNNKDPKKAGILTSDGVHLNAAGNKFVADLLLKMLEQ